MKRVLSLITAIALCVALLSSLAFAEGFVPSIGDKDHPEIVPGEGASIGQIIGEGDQIISNVEEGCLVITPVADAETSTQIPEDAREILLNVYNQLISGNMELPYDSSINPADMVIRDLFDLSFICQDHPEMLAAGNQLKLTFDLGVAAGDVVVAMVFVDGEWINVELANNGDGTVTCLFSQLCPVVFAVKQTETPPQTGDFAGNDILLWGLLMAGSVIAIAVCVVIYRRKVTHHN